MLEWLMVALIVAGIVVIGASMAIEGRCRRRDKKAIEQALKDAGYV